MAAFLASSKSGRVYCFMHVMMYVNLCDLLLQKRTKPDWQDVSPEFKLFPGVTKDMIGAEQRPHTNTVSGLPSLLRPPVNKGRQLGMYMYMYLHVAKRDAYPL